MRSLFFACIDAFIPLGSAVLILVFPQWFTKRDLKAEENKGLAGKLKIIGWVLMAAGVLILIGNIGSVLTKK